MPQPSGDGGNKPKIRLKEKSCDCGNKCFDFARMKNGGFNKNPYTRCRDCAIKEREEKSRALRRVASFKNRNSASSD